MRIPTNWLDQARRALGSDPALAVALLLVVAACAFLCIFWLMQWALALANSLESGLSAAWPSGGPQPSQPPTLLGRWKLFMPPCLRP